MEKKYTAIIILFLLGGFVVSGCKKSNTPPVSERIAKIWSAENVKEGSVVVYTKGGTSNTRDYSKFNLGLNSSGTVSYQDWDGVQFSGQWSVTGDSELTLTNLNPIPTGTNGTIKFQILTLGDNQVVLRRTDGNRKTGNTMNEYTLQNP